MHVMKIQKKALLYVVFIYPNTSYRVFGMKAVANIRLLLVAILRLLCYDLTKLASKARYVEREDFQNLEKAYNGLEKYFKNRLIVNTAKNGEHSILCALDNGTGLVILKLNINSDFPQILLTNSDSNGRHKNGIYLFINETIFILKYLNSRFKFEDVIRENEHTKKVKAIDSYNIIIGKWDINWNHSLYRKELAKIYTSHMTKNFNVVKMHCEGCQLELENQLGHDLRIISDMKEQVDTCLNTLFEKVDNYQANEQCFELLKDMFSIGTNAQ